MTTPELTALLAEQVMRWTVAPGRYLMGHRRWIPAWRFEPTKRLEDAFRLLDAADPDEYSIHARRGSGFSVRVKITGTAGEACDTSKPRAITFAVARAVGLEPDCGESVEAGVKRR